MAKRILPTACIAFAGLVLFIIVLFIEPNSQKPTLPTWLTRVKLTHKSKVESNSGFQIEEARSLKVSPSELDQRLDKDLNPAEGWRKTSSTAELPSWYARTNADGLRLWSIKTSNGVVVYTNWDHEVTFAEKLKRKIRSMFGAKD